MTNLFALDDAEIIRLRKSGANPAQLLDSFTSRNLLIDPLICLTHVLRVCHEHNLPLSRGDCRRLYKKNFDRAIHVEVDGTPLCPSLNSLYEFTTRHKIIIKKMRPPRRDDISRITAEKSAPPQGDNSQTMQMPVQSAEGGK